MNRANPPQSTRILFIGNSFTARNDLPLLLAQLAASGDAPRYVGTDRVIANGASLRQHWNAGTALDVLRQGTWDYVVLQEQSTLPIKNPARFHENVRLFDSAIKEQGARPVLYLTWARQSAPESQENLTTATMQIAGELDAVVVPVGVAWQATLQEDAALTLHDKDGSHPSPAGSYLAACVFYATLLGASPVGLTVPERIKLNETDAALIQRVAWRTASLA